MILKDLIHPIGVLRNQYLRYFLTDLILVITLLIETRCFKSQRAQFASLIQKPHTLSD